MRKIVIVPVLPNGTIDLSSSDDIPSQSGPEGLGMGNAPSDVEAFREGHKWDSKGHRRKNGGG